MKRKFKLMVNNSSDINKMYSHLSSQTIEHKKGPQHGIGYPGPSLRQVQKCGGIKLVNGILILSLLITESPLTIQL